MMGYNFVLLDLIDTLYLGICVITYYNSAIGSRKLYKNDSICATKYAVTLDFIEICYLKVSKNVDYESAFGYYKFDLAFPIEGTKHFI